MVQETPCHIEHLIMTNEIYSVYKYNEMLPFYLKNKNIYYDIYQGETLVICETLVISDFFSK